MIRWFTHNSVAANLFMLLIMMSGLVVIFSDVLPIEVFPDSPPRFIKVSVAYPGSSPEDVEQGVLLQLEAAIDLVSGVKQIIGNASSSGANVTVEVDEHVDILRVMDDIKIQIDAIQDISELAEKPIVQLMDTQSTVISVILASQLPEKEMRNLADQLKDQLQNLPGVSQTSVGGIRNQEINIEISEETLIKHQLTMDRISQAIRQNSIDLPAGLIQLPTGDLSIRVKGKAYTGEQFAAIPISIKPDGSGLSLGDIALIEDGFSPNPMVAKINNLPCVVVNVFRENFGNAINTAETVKTYMAEKAKLPHGTQVIFWNDRSKIVTSRIQLLIQNAQGSLILVFFCVGLFLRLDSVFWLAVGMCASFLGAFTVMYLLNVSINISSLFGFILVLGIVVDDAIVISEHVDTLRKKGMSWLEASITGTKEMAVPITFGVLTTVAAFLPLTLANDSYASSFKPIAIIFIIVMLIALVETKLILPSHLANRTPLLSDIADLFAPVNYFFQNSLQVLIVKIYQPTLQLCVQFRYITLSVFISILVLVTGYFLGDRIPWTPFPRLLSERVEAKLKMSDGTSFSTTEKQIQRILEEAEKIKIKYSKDGISVVKNIVATYGAQGTLSTREHQSSPQTNLGEVIIETLPPESRPISITTAEIEIEWRKAIGVITGAEQLTFRSEIMRFNDPIDIMLSSTRINQMQEASQKIKVKLETTNGLFDISDTLEQGRSELLITPKPEAYLHGITLNEIARQVRYAYYGELIQRLQINGKEVKVMLRYPKFQRENINSISQINIRNSKQQEIPLHQIATITPSKAFSIINHVDRKRTINITADVNKNQTNPITVRTGLKPEIEEIMMHYPDVEWSFEGEARTEAEGSNSLIWSSLFIGLSLFTLMAIPLKSYIQPLLVLFMIPFGIIGAIFGHLIHGLPLSFLSAFGILAVSGVIVNDSLVLVDRINQLNQEEEQTHGAIIQAATSRFQAIFLTQITTFIGLVPIIFSLTFIDDLPWGIRHLGQVVFGDNRLAQTTSAQSLTPVSVAMGYGSLFSTFIMLYLLPICYVIFDDITKFTKKLTNKKIKI